MAKITTMSQPKENRNKIYGGAARTYTGTQVFLNFGLIFKKED